MEPSQARPLRDALVQILAEELRSPCQPETPSALTLDDYFHGQFLPRRKQLQLVSVDDDASRYRLHVQPILGHMQVHQIRPRHIHKVIVTARQAGLAPRTVRLVKALLSILFRCIVADELLASSPVVLPPGLLPPNVDRDPLWRARAIYDRNECEALVSDHRLQWPHRILYALKFFAALRHSEAATLHWWHLERREPLSALLVGKTKAHKPRTIPIHPTLQWLLSDWRLHGYVETYGHAPNAEDLIVPTLAGTIVEASNAQHALQRDVDLLGLRRRRGHDLRRSMITHARSDGVRDEVLRAITHGPRQDIQEQYTSWPWDVLCAEMAKLRISVGAAAQLSMPLEVRSVADHVDSKRRAAHASD